MLRSKLWKTLMVRFRKGPIDSVEALSDFVQTRSSYVAQTSLYGYLKNRMGISYPRMFDDDTMATSINMAKWRTYGSCLADLSIFAAAYVYAQSQLSETQAVGLARRCFDLALANTFDEAGAEYERPEILAAFAERLATVDWNTAADGENAFRNSPVDLLRFAPIAEELKAFDNDIVINSTRFRWRDVRNQLKDRIKPDKVTSDYLMISGTFPML